MFNFILNMYTMKRIDAAQVLAFVDKYITQEQADTILGTAP